MDRHQLEKLLGSGGGVGPAATAVHLPDADVDLRLVELTQSVQIKVGAYATDVGDPEEQEGRAVIATLRWAVRDDHDKPLFRSYDEATRFLDAISTDDFVAIGAALTELNRAVDDVADVEAGKESSAGTAGC